MPNLMAFAGTGSEDELQEARQREADLVDSVRENEDAAARYRADVAANEAARREVQEKIDAAIALQEQSPSIVKILSAFRMQARPGGPACLSSRLRRLHAFHAVATPAQHA
jgi:hypothetical protein